MAILVFMFVAGLASPARIVARRQVLVVGGVVAKAIGRGLC
jgi:hypothetical protein